VFADPATLDHGVQQIRRVLDDVRLLLTPSCSVLNDARPSSDGGDMASEEMLGDLFG
jgi:hypothetical protein